MYFRLLKVWSTLCLKLRMTALYQIYHCQLPNWKRGNPKMGEEANKWSNVSHHLSWFCKKKLKNSEPKLFKHNWLTVLFPGGFENMKALAISMAPWFKAPKVKAIASRTKFIVRLWLPLFWSFTSDHLEKVCISSKPRKEQCMQEEIQMQTGIRFPLLLFFISSAGWVSNAIAIAMV